jgi:hypothetical protein
MIFAASPLSHCLRNSLGYIARPALGDIESHHSRRVGILAVHNFADDSPFIDFCLIRGIGKCNKRLGTFGVGYHETFFPDCPFEKSRARHRSKDTVVSKE